MWPDDDPKMSWAEREMTRGFMDGYDVAAPRPSKNRSLSYRWGFVNALRDRGEHPRFTNAAQARRIADYIIRRDNRGK